MGFFSWFAPSPEKKHNEEIRRRILQDIKSDRTSKRLRITVPKDDWHPEKAAALMAVFFRLQNYTLLKFLIGGYEDKNSPTIQWHIQLYIDLVPTVTNLIYSIYPNASIEGYGELSPEGFIEIDLYSSAPFFAPFIYVQDCKVDPLSQVLGVLNDLKDVDVWLELQMFEASHTYNQIGTKAIHTKQGNDAIKIILSAVASRGKVILPPIPKPTNKYETPYQRQFEDKVNSELRIFRYVIKVKCENHRRREELFSVLSHAVTVFERDPGNLLTTKRGYNLVLTVQEAAALWHLPSREVTVPGVTWLPATYGSIPQELVNNTEGLFLGGNTYRAQYQSVYLPLPDRITHMNIIGKTRVGKTTFMHNLIHQDIAAGRGVGVIDPHGDLIKAILAGSIPKEREKDVILFDLANPRRLVPLNLLYVPQGASPHAAVGSTIAVLKKIFAEAWSQTRMEDALYAALAVLVAMRGATIRDIPRLFFEEDYRQLVLANATDPVALEYFHNDFERMSESHQLEVARPIMNRIRTFYRNPVIEQVVAQPDSLDLKYIMDQGKILLVSLAGEATQAEAATIGALLISKLQMAAMSRYSSQNRRMFYLYIDEVQNFITTSLSTMFSEAAKYGLSLTVANQYMRQLEGGTLDAILGNTGTTVMFAMGNQDAKDLGPYVKPNFDSQTLLDLDRFEAIVRMQHQGKTLPAFWMKTPSPVKLPDKKPKKPKLSKAAQKASALLMATSQEIGQSEDCADFCRQKRGFLKKSRTPRSNLEEHLHEWVAIHPEDKEQYSEFLNTFTHEFWKYHHSVANSHDSVIESYITFIGAEMYEEVEEEEEEKEFILSLPLVQSAPQLQSVPSPQAPKPPDREVPDLNL